MTIIMMMKRRIRKEKLVEKEGIKAFQYFR